jgi:hypothetical protein
LQTREVVRRILESNPRNDRGLVFENFGLYAARELDHVANFFLTDVAGLAWATRNLFELNLIVRHVLASEENVRLWLGQSLSDEPDFIEGLLSTSRESDATGPKRVLEDRVRALGAMAERHGLNFAKPFRVRDLAEQMGEIDEYTGLYKLFSKYVHPASLVINSPRYYEATDEWANVFLVKAQFYAGNTIGRISQAFKVGGPA